MTPVVEIISSIDTWDCMELTGFGTVDETVESRDKQTGCEKSFANCACDMYSWRAIPRICNKVKNLNT